ncbi:hypothetical protein MIND_00165400 [Mycena indigotica]|uniref:Transmembrane protein n=1 Tax=Mycena indigotica TaxID=2126181 RepID=A0A8H6TEX2_9AGAR|nr:uncharacterized protein MIND_00165400 [Mycena indigotica]KAF7316463.1 hypothetical protein MIND_00165400 [Mycena indigotica]
MGPARLPLVFSLLSLLLGQITLLLAAPVPAPDLVLTFGGFAMTIPGPGGIGPGSGFGNPGNPIGGVPQGPGNPFGRPTTTTTTTTEQHRITTTAPAPPPQTHTTTHEETTTTTTTKTSAPKTVVSIQGVTQTPADWSPSTVSSVGIMSIMSIDPAASGISSSNPVSSTSSSSGLIAKIVVPILILLLLWAVAVVYFYRRRKGAATRGDASHVASRSPNNGAWSRLAMSSRGDLASIPHMHSATVSRSNTPRSPSPPPPPPPPKTPPPVPTQATMAVPSSSLARSHTVSTAHGGGDGASVFADSPFESESPLHWQDEPALADSRPTSLDGAPPPPRFYPDSPLPALSSRRLSSMYDPDTLLAYDRDSRLL